MELVETILARDHRADDGFDLPLAVTVTMGVLAALLVGLSVASTVRAGLLAVGVGFVLSIGVVLATLVVFEFGRRLGAA
ncbi:hypothetical protein BRC81_16885 [Halobacteriales archaeon QS_1_68_20]|nr:MAG: hypothetical protein BRC81_16885 [Halobacteriales archaeon QS_1_68_20]